LSSKRTIKHLMVRLNYVVHSWIWTI